MNNKSDLLKKSSTILLATVLVAGFIGISTPFSIFAQNYYEDYETEEYSQYYDDYATDYNNYEKYMKDDYTKPSNQKISCNNIIKNIPDDNNVDSRSTFDVPNGDSQSGQRIDRMNTDGYSGQKGDFVYICQNNNFEIQNIVNNGDNSLSFVHNNTLTQNQNASFTTSMVCGNGFIEGDNGAVVFTGNNITCSITQNVTQIGNLTDNTENNAPGVISPSSITDVEQSLAKTQQINTFENDNGISIQQQGKEDSAELAATEKVEKLKAQYVELYQ